MYSRLLTWAWINVKRMRFVITGAVSANRFTAVGRVASVDFLGLAVYGNGRAAIGDGFQLDSSEKDEFKGTK